MRFLLVVLLAAVQPVIAKPVRICVLVDLSASMGKAPDFTLEHITPLLDILTRHGGELGVMAIAADATDNIIRIRLDAPPKQPTKPSKEIENPFERRKVMKAYRREFASSEKLRDEHSKRSKLKTDAALAQLQPLLERKRKSQYTNLTDALSRANLMLSEPATDTRDYVVVYSDCQHDSKNPAPEAAGIALLDETTLVLINGAHPAALAYLQDQNPNSFFQFEAIESALRFISQLGG